MTTDPTPTGSAEDSPLSRRIDALAATVDETAADPRSGADGGAPDEQVSRLRTAVEERLATVEDALDGMADRLEAVVREAMRESVDQLQRVEQRLDALSDWQTRVDQLVGDDGRPAPAPAAVVEASTVDAWSETVSVALSDLGRAVERSLGSLAQSMSGTVPAASAATAGAEGSGWAGELSSLRGDLADVLEETRDRLLLAVESGTSTVMARISARDDALAALGGTLAELRAEVTEALGDVSGVVVDALDQPRSSGEVAEAPWGEAWSQVQGRLGQLDESLDAVRASVGELSGSWSETSGELASESRAAVGELLASIRAQLGDAVTSTGEALGRHTEETGRAADVLRSSGDRLVLAGQGLLAYLVDRDAVLELDRDRILAELLEQFAAGLSAKERAAAGSRLSAALERRRDSRDASRWRSREEQPARPETPGPVELAALADVSAEVPDEGTLPPAAATTEPEPEIVTVDAAVPVAPAPAATVPADRAGRATTTAPTTTAPTAAAPAKAVRKKAAPAKAVRKKAAPAKAVPATEAATKVASPTPRRTKASAAAPAAGKRAAAGTAPRRASAPAATKAAAARRTSSSAPDDPRPSDDPRPADGQEPHGTAR